MSLPCGSLSGKNRQKSGDCRISGQSRLTDNSSYLGTLMKFTFPIGMNSFSSARICLRKSLLTMVSGGKYNCTVGNGVSLRADLHYSEKYLTKSFLQLNLPVKCAVGSRLFFVPCSYSICYKLRYYYYCSFIWLLVYTIGAFTIVHIISQLSMENRAIFMITISVIILQNNMQKVKYFISYAHMFYREFKQTSINSKASTALK